MASEYGMKWQCPLNQLRVFMSRGRYKCRIGLNRGRVVLLKNPNLFNFNDLCKLPE